MQDRAFQWSLPAQQDIKVQSRLLMMLLKLHQESTIEQASSSSLSGQISEASTCFHYCAILSQHALIIESDAPLFSSSFSLLFHAAVKPLTPSLLTPPPPLHPNLPFASTYSHLASEWNRPKQCDENHTPKLGEKVEEEGIYILPASDLGGLGGKGCQGSGGS